MLAAMSILLAVGALLALAYPIVAHSWSAPSPSTRAGEGLEELLARREAAFQALRDLNFDHQVGKVSDEDFASFETGLKQAAASALRALDAWEEQIDQQLAQAIGPLNARGQAEASTGSICPSCGAANSGGDRFCTRCGQTLVPAVRNTAGGLACPQCGRVCDSGDRFCPSCGKPLPTAMLQPS